ncbi:MAG: CoA-binding protein, partial [Bacteroides sp.]|nr:CoA-binding protein [Bacteroides sp.]
FFNKDKNVAIVGASPNKENFGRYLIKELGKKEYNAIPVNPKYDNVEGINTVPTVKDLPKEVTNVILAVPSSLTEIIIDQCIDTHIQRVWMIRGMGRGAYTEKAHQKCIENGIEVVYGFCPMMFMGEGMHKFHFWLRKRFGKLPAEYLVSEN